MDTPRLNSVLLLSGGVDSAALCYWKKPAFALTVNYGQIPFEAELLASKRICDFVGVEHMVIHAPINELGSGDLAGRPVNGGGPGIQYSEWWPFRNQFLITLAAMKAIQIAADEVMIGSVSSDSIFVDGSAAFTSAMDSLTRIQEGGIRVSAPAHHLSSIQLLRQANVPEQILSMTHSCHVSNYSCGDCWGCRKNLDIFEALGLY